MFVQRAPTKVAWDGVSAAAGATFWITASMNLFSFPHPIWHIFLFQDMVNTTGDFLVSMAGDATKASYWLLRMYFGLKAFVVWIEINLLRRLNKTWFFALEIDFLQEFPQVLVKNSINVSLWSCQKTYHLLFQVQWGWYAQQSAISVKARTSRQG